MYFKKILIFTTSLILCYGIMITPQVSNSLGSMVISAENEEYTGLCGKSATYSFDESTGILTISGTGVIYNTTSLSDYKDNIKSVIIEDGINFISLYMFNGYTSLTEVTIPNSITTISSSAFRECDNLTDVYFNGTNKEWNAIQIGDYNEPLTNATIHYSQTDTTPINKVDSILDTVNLTQRDTIYCYDCSSDMNSTDIMYTYKINDNDKQILQNFIDENFTDDMSNTEKIQYTMDWLHNNITYTLSEDYGTLSNSLAECGFVQKAGQCLQYNGALAYMLAYMGYDTNLIFLKSGSWQHFTCQVRIDGKAYRMEVGNKGLDDGSHYMYQQFLDLETDVNVDENTIIGKCGESATYSFDKSTGVLTISGIGDMWYSSPLDNDWYFYNDKTDEIEDFSKDIKSVVIEDGITSIGLGTFNDCTSLENVTLPDSLLWVGGFYNCTSLKSIVIPDNVTHIIDYAFYGCTSLTDITIPNSVTFIAPYAFDNTPFLENQTDDFIILGNGILYKYQGIETEVTIPNNVTIIESGAFANNENLISVTIPNSATGFDTLYINDGAFSGCASLTDIYFDGTEEEWNAIEIGEGNTPLINANIHFMPTTTDILNLKKYLLGISDDNTNLDFNSDGKVNILDLVTLKNQITN